MNHQVSNVIKFSCGCEVVFKNVNNTIYPSESSSSFCSLKDKILLSVTFPIVFLNDWIKLVPENEKKETIHTPALKKLNKVLESLVQELTGNQHEVTTDKSLEEFIAEFITSIDNNDDITNTKDPFFVPYSRIIKELVIKEKVLLKSKELPKETKNQLSEAISLLSSLVLVLPQDRENRDFISDISLLHIVIKLMQILGIESSSPLYREVLYGSKKAGAIVE